MSREFDDTPHTRAEFIKLPNILRQKVGYGGLSEENIQKAEQLLKNNTVDFIPLSEVYLNGLMSGISYAKSATIEDDKEYVIASMLYPAVQLKANGAMFHYPLVTRIAGRLVQFLEIIIQPDNEVIEIVIAFHSAIRAVVAGKVTGDGGKYGDELSAALGEACMRYQTKHGIG